MNPNIKFVALLTCATILKPISADPIGDNELVLHVGKSMSIAQGTANPFIKFQDARSYLAQLPDGTQSPDDSGNECGEEYFCEDFDDELSRDTWEIINENSEGFIVEDGKLVILATKAGKISDEKQENLFLLKKAMPNGNWTMTVKFLVEYQTGLENIVLGIYHDQDNFVLAKSEAIHTCCGHYDNIKISGWKRLNSETKGFTKMLVSYANNDREKWKGWVDGLAQPQQLRLEKVKRQYIVSSRFSEGEWLTLSKLTALRMSGNLILGFDLTSNTKEEALVFIDWVKLEE